VAGDNSASRYPRLNNSFPLGNLRRGASAIISAAAILPAVTGLVVVHRAVLAALLAALRRGFGRKRACANRRRQNRKQNLRVRLHVP